MKELISKLSTEVENEAIAHRRHLHKYPEVSFKEAETSKYIQKMLDEYGIKFTTINNSVIGRIKGEKPGKTVAFRADIDALPIQEENNVSYRSKVEGVMHACGHDAHTAALLGLARIFSANQQLIEGEIIFVFQHAEELLPGGAIVLVESGLMDYVDTIFGFHVWPDIETGTIGYSRGALMACTDRFHISIKGQGGHGSTPHRTKDSLLAGTALVQQLQSIISRNVSPQIAAVLSVCYFNAGSAFNIIPDSCELGGTIRTTDEETRSLIKQRIQEVCNGMALSHGLEIDITYEMGYPVLVNDADTVDKTVEGILQLTGYKAEVVAPVMGGEDFAYFTQLKPGAYFFVGCKEAGKESASALHTPFFDIDEKAIKVGIEVFLAGYFSL